MALHTDSPLLRAARSGETPAARKLLRAVADVTKTERVDTYAAGVAQAALGREILAGPVPLEHVAIDRRCRVAVVAGPRLVQVWKLLKSGRLAAVFDHRAASVAIRPDGKLITVGMQNGEVLCIDWQKEREVARRRVGDGSHPVTALAWDRESAILAAMAEDGSLALWRGDEDVRASGAAGRGPLLFTPDGEHLLVGSAHGDVQVRRAPTGELGRTLEQPFARLGGLAIDDDQELIAAVGVEDEDHVQVCAWTDGSLVAVLPTSADALAFRPNTRQLAVATPRHGDIYLWNATDGSSEPQPTGVHPESRVELVHFAPTGKYFVSASFQDATIRSYQVMSRGFKAKGLPNAAFGEPSGLFALSTTQAVVATAMGDNGRGVTVWGMYRESCIMQYPDIGEVAALAFAGDSVLMVQDERGFHLYPEYVDHLVLDYFAPWEPLPAAVAGATGASVLVLLDSAGVMHDWLVDGGSSNDVRARLSKRGQVETGVAHVVAAALDPQEERVALATEEELLVVELGSGEVLARTSGGGGRVRALVWSERGVAALCDRCGVRMWDIDAGEDATPWVLQEPGASRLEGALDALAVTPDGRWAASRDTDGRAHLWDVEARRTVATHAETLSSCRTLRFTHCGLGVLLGSRLGVRFWDVGDEVA